MFSANFIVVFIYDLFDHVKIEQSSNLTNVRHQIFQLTYIISMEWDA